MSTYNCLAENGVYQEIHSKIKKFNLQVSGNSHMFKFKGVTKFECASTPLYLIHLRVQIELCSLNKTRLIFEQFKFYLNSYEFQTPPSLDEIKSKHLFRLK